MGHPAPRHKTPDRKIRRAVAHEAKEWSIALTFWGVVTSPLFAGALLGWLWALFVTFMWIGIAFTIFMYLIVGGRSNAQLKDPAYREARTRQWYMGPPLPELPAQVRWPEFEQSVDAYLHHKDDPWAEIGQSHQDDLLRRATTDPQPVVGEPAPGYSIEQRTGEVIYEQIYVDQCSEPVLLPVGEYPPLEPLGGHSPGCSLRGFPAGLGDVYNAVENGVAVGKCRHCHGIISGPKTPPEEVFSMLCGNCGCRSVPRSTGLCKKCEGVVSPFPMPAMDDLTTEGAKRSLKNALKSVYATPGEMIIPTRQSRMSKRQIEEALDGMSAARRKELIVSLRKAGIIQ